MKNLMSQIKSVAHQPAGLMSLTQSLLNAAIQHLNHPACGLQIAAPFQLEGNAAHKHLHRYPEIFIQLAGSHEFRTPGQTILQKPGEVVVIPTLTPHQETRHPARRCWCHWVGMFQENRFNYHLTVYHPWPHLPQGIVAANFLIPENYLLLRELSEELGRNTEPATQLACMKALLQLIKEKLEFKPNKQLSISHRARTLIVQSLTDPQLSVSSLAEQLGCHPDYLSREFSKTNGRTLRVYIRDQRMLLASELLHRGKLEIQDVARLCGYNDHAYFTAEFRRANGMTPSVFRKKIRRD
ncbi:MAG: AraC family transcriptional regulator [Verrucomicrobiales bacterium]|jgi:AraC-like DNA-binding protein/mannose-6-phosphate isomerase-like protein (cupin superfamily)|nr:AraC family transcriptional regulator [Verrucomicrobiales bacterium]